MTWYSVRGIERLTVGSSSTLAARALENAQRMLAIGWIPLQFGDSPGRLVLNSRGQPTLPQNYDVAYVSLLPALWRGFWLETRDFAVTESRTTELLERNTDPRRTRFAVHPVLLHRSMPARSLLNFSCTATKNQCLDLVEHLLREEE